jgi:hypothetical protein
MATSKKVPAMNALKRFEITVSKNQHEIPEQPMLQGVLPMSATSSVIYIEFIRLFQITVELFQRISRDFGLFAVKQSEFVSHVTDDNSCARHLQRDPFSGPSGNLLLPRAHSLHPAGSRDSKSSRQKVEILAYFIRRRELHPDRKAIQPS